MLVDFRHSLVWCCVLLTAGALNIPILITQRRRITNDDAVQLAYDMLGPDDYSSTMSGEIIVVRSADGLKRLEYDTLSGGISATDTSESWNPTAGPPPNLPSDAEAMKLAMEIIERFGLKPSDKQLPPGIEITIESDRTSGTFVAHEFGDGAGGYTREQWRIDVSSFLDTKIKVPDYPELIPVTGGGGRLLLVLGSNNRLLEIRALWREIVDQRPYELMSQVEAEAIYIASAGALQDSVTIISSFVAYYSEPWGLPQNALYPVWVINGNAVLGPESISVRPQATRESSGTGSSSQKSYGVPPPKRRSVPSRSTQRRQSNDDAILFEAASEWMGAPYGLGLAENNAAGFRYGIQGTAPLGVYSYEKDNELVWESDFVSDDDEWVDSVDMLFYTGHANANGWMVADPATGDERFIDYSSFGVNPETPGDLLGQQDLEWLIIAACGPFQDELVNPGDGNVFDRWRGIFDGLHIMFGYASASLDTDGEGARFIKYAKEGETLINAWFRTAKELQNSEVVVAAMWTDDAFDDHLPGYGSVSSDNPLGSQERWVMWTTC
ncbi:hypothetical protein DFP73DRAFT_539877 [Morchella snyderi]|nr:hypothetical protein DFP73DRAFT_539877 [Morchella snyderi]